MMKIKNLIAMYLLTLIMLGAINKTQGQIVYSDIKDTTIYIPNAPYADSSNYYFFDINNDLVLDFRFVTTTFFDGGYHPPHTGKAIGLTPATFPSLNYIAGGCFGYNTYLINSGDTINKNSVWNFAQYIKYIQTGIDWSCEVPTGEFFLGLKLVISPDTLYGWVRCTATDTSVTIKDYAYNAAPNTYILAGQTVSGIVDNYVNENAQISVFPNPFDEIITFEFPEALPDINLSIYDVYSRLLSTTNASNTNKIILQDADLPKGIYFYRLTSKNTVVKTGKVIKD